VCAGRAFVELGMYDQAIQILKQAENTVRSENYRKFLITNLGIAYARKKVYRQAIPYLEKAVQFSPELQGLLSECYKQLQK
jgi:tetratricopeptide (TPR) repeat protein